MYTTRDWVRNPNLAPTGFKDSAVFVSVVTAIFEQARAGRDHSDLVRDLLTYLLLRRNPATDVSIILDHIQPGMDGNVPTDIELLKDATKRSLERYVNHEPSQPYSVVMLLQKMILNPAQNWANPEEFTLLCLSMWLFTRTISTVDIGTQRSCLRLYFDSLAYRTDNREREFINSPVRIASWIWREIERLFFDHKDTSKLIGELAYVGSFASLLRASRMTGEQHPLKSILRDEIALLQSKTTLK